MPIWVVPILAAVTLISGSEELVQSFVLLMFLFGVR